MSMVDAHVFESLGFGPNLLFPESDATMALDVLQRWELTRRHPYYLKCWALARRFYEHVAGEGPKPADWPLMQASVELLWGLNVPGPYYQDPAWQPESEELRERLKRQGAAARATLRGLARRLVMLPEPVRKAIGRIFLQDNVAEGELVIALDLLSHYSLDTPIGELVQFTLAAPEKAILGEMARIVRGGKQAQGRKQVRRRPEEITEYLKVWDLREGWMGSGYDGGQERRLLAVAMECQIPLPTAQDRYKRAFWYILGRPYTPYLWAVRRHSREMGR
jgi:hypothetical protein